MLDKFQNKYRNGTFRAQWWDYGWNGAYFITICTKNREHHFGEIENGKMILSHTGVIASILWNEIPKHHDFVELGDFVVMPNHVHGILIINNPNKMDNGDEMMETENGVGFDNTVGSGKIIGSENTIGFDNTIDSENTIGFDYVGSGHALNLHVPNPQHTPNPQHAPHPQNPNHQNPNPQNPGAQRFQNIGKNTLSSIVGSYKSAVTKYANRLGFPNGWQSLFHEHIIRNDAAYQRISDYIVTNPENWEKDKFC